MDKLTFSKEVRTITHMFSEKEQMIVQKMIDVLTLHEENFNNPTYYISIRNKTDEETGKMEPFFAIGFKTRPLDFITLSFNRSTQEVTQTKSKLANRSLPERMLLSPEGKETLFPAQTFMYSEQVKETLSI